MTGIATLPARSFLENIDSNPDLVTGPALDRKSFQDIRRRMVLEHFKWDPQVEDVSVLQPFPLLLRRSQWCYLAIQSEALAREVCAAERGLMAHPDLFPKLAIPHRLTECILRGLRSQPEAAARVMRFDFHPTPAGWRISEVNSDVPGGFSEASEFPAMMSEHFRGYVPAEAPGPALADALVRTIAMNGGRACALVSAAGFMEDLQVVSYLARLLRRRGVETHLGNPLHLKCDHGKLVMNLGVETVPLSLVVRFHQAEWLSDRIHASIAPHLLGGSDTPVINPGYAMLGESKRLPLVWDDLGLKMEAWRRLLPETRDPRDGPWLRDSGWLLKTAFCNTGDSVSSPLTMPRRKWIRAAADATLFPRHWVAQRRFEVDAIDTPAGAMYPCLGVYTIGGRACGIYGRLSRTPVVTYAAADVAVLVEKEPE